MIKHMYIIEAVPMVGSGCPVRIEYIGKTFKEVALTLFKDNRYNVRSIVTMHQVSADEPVGIKSIQKMKWLGVD